MVRRWRRLDPGPRGKTGKWTPPLISKQCNVDLCDASCWNFVPSLGFLENWEVVSDRPWTDFARRVRRWEESRVSLIGRCKLDLPTGIIWLATEGDRGLVSVYTEGDEHMKCRGNSRTLNAERERERETEKRRPMIQQ